MTRNGHAAGLAAIDAATLANTISSRLAHLHKVPAEYQHQDARETLAMCRYLTTQVGKVATAIYVEDYHRQVQAARADLAMWRDGEQ